MSNYIHVAVGVIKRAGGEVLLAKRRDDAHQGGLWEFPGGKVESGESVQSALGRELKEELAIDVVHSQPLIQVRHHYSDKSVLLDVWEVDSYRGSPKGNEGQALTWVGPDQLEAGSDCPYPLPAANAAIIKALRMPDTMLITGEFADKNDFLSRLERALQCGIRLVQFRSSPSMDRLSEGETLELLQRARALCEQNAAKLVLNAAKNVPLDTAHGIHLPAAQLMASHCRPVSASQIFGASCHKPEELERAAKLNADYVLLSPVKPTPSHRDAKVLGWNQFLSLTQAINVPVYALGGMHPEDLAQAKAVGAQGIAAITAFWNR